MVQVKLCVTPGIDCIDPRDLLALQEPERMDEKAFGSRAKRIIDNWAARVKEGERGIGGVFDVNYLERFGRTTENYGLTDCSSGRCKISFWLTKNNDVPDPGHNISHGWYYDESIHEQADIIEGGANEESELRVAEKIRDLTHSWYHPYTTGASK